MPDCGCNVITGPCLRHGWPLLVVIALACLFPFAAFGFMVWAMS